MFVRRLTWGEWLVVVAIAIVIVLILLPAPRWGASGSMLFPIRVFVFDAAHAHPIPNARVVAFTGRLPRRGIDIDAISDRISKALAIEENLESVGVTAQDGTAVVQYEFRTEANDSMREPHAALWYAWVVVAAEGYTKVIMPVRYDFMPTAKLREQKELFVPVGLMSTETAD